MVCFGRRGGKNASDRRIVARWCLRVIFLLKNLYHINATVAMTMPIHVAFWAFVRVGHMFRHAPGGEEEASSCSRPHFHSSLKSPFAPLSWTSSLHPSCLSSSSSLRAPLPSLSEPAPPSPRFTLIRNINSGVCWGNKELLPLLPASLPPY